MRDSPMRDPRSAIPLTAVACVALFIGIYQLGLGILFYFIPSLPLFMLGLSQRAEALLTATLLAALGIGALSGAEGMLFFLAYLGIPALLMAPRALLPDASAPSGWHPVGGILTDMSAYGALVTAALEIHLQPAGGIQGALISGLKEGLATADPALQAAFIEFFSSNTFFIVGVSAWWWILLLYAHMAFANALLKRRGRCLRESLALEPFQPPLWALGALTLAGIGSLWPGDAGFIARATLMIFLLPYYLLGVSFARLRMQHWPNRKWWLFTLYLMSALYLAPVFLLAAVGVWQQCKALRRPVA